MLLADHILDSGIEWNPDLQADLQGRLVYAPTESELRNSTTTQLTHLAGWYLCNGAPHCLSQKRMCLQGV